MPIDPNLTLSTQAILILLGMIGLIFLAIATSWAIVIERVIRKVPIIPDRSGGAVPWRGGQVFVCFAIWQFAMLSVAGILRSRRGADGEPDIVAAFAALSVINLAMTIGLPLMLAAWNGASSEDFGIARGRIGKDLRIGIIAAIFCLPLVYMIQFLAILIWQPTAHPLQEMLLLQQDPAILLLALGSAVIFAPAAEELLFRGIFQGWLDSRFGSSRTRNEDVPKSEPEDTFDLAPIDSRDSFENPYLAPGTPLGQASTLGVEELATHRRWGNRLSLFVPAVIFAAVHAAQWPAPIPLFVLAIGLGLVYRRTKGLIAPVAMHATFNGVSTLAMIVIVLVIPTADPNELPGPTEPPVPAVAETTADREEDSLSVPEASGATTEVQSPEIGNLDGDFAP